MKRSVLADNNRVRPDQPAREELDRLDSLRTDFFVDLSHQLRTPLTAMKLAIDGLFAQLRGKMNPSQRNLASISRRNVDRITGLIENQLDLLRMMAGDRCICRRLVDINNLVAERVEHASGSDDDVTGRGTISFAAQSGEADPGPLFAFTAPELLLPVIDGLLCVSSPDAKRSVTVDYHRPTGTCRVEIDVDLCPLPDVLSGPGSGAPAGDGRDDVPDFECRAYDAVLALVGGQIEMEKDDNHKHARLYLPRYPEYDPQKDLPEPAGGEAGDNVVCIVVDLGDDAGPDYLESRNRFVRDVLDRCISVAGDRDRIVRAGRAGTIGLVLKDRTPDDVENVVSFLEAGMPSGANGDGRRGPSVRKRQLRDLDSVWDELEGVGQE
jgi:hypothetical protein